MKPLRRLVQRQLLDPRPAACAQRGPIADAVNIPRSELPARMHELPPRDIPLMLTDVEDAQDACAWLAAHGRRPALTSAFVAQAPPPDECGRLWRPTGLLERVASQDAAGGGTLEALDVGCGTGRDAVFLAAAGWRVTAVDVLPDAVARGRDLERRYQCGGPPIAWHVAAAQTWRAAQRFDLVTLFRFVSRDVLRQAGALVRPGGWLLCEFFSPVHAQRHGRPHGAGLIDADELCALLQADFRLDVEAGWRGNAHTLQVVARRASAAQRGG